MKQEVLNKIIAEHQLWLENEKEGKCADLRCADLSNLNLSNTNLSYADLSHTILINTNLSNTNLSYADLSNSWLHNANLNNVNLKDTILTYADFSNVDLNNVDEKYIPENLPNGELIGYKKVDNYIIKLKILEDSKRSKATSNKCRCNKALVLEIQNKDGSISGLQEITNYSCVKTIYKVGEIVYSDSWDDNRWCECSHGIHFFLDREDAVKYCY